jgi:hypothetical protein
MEVSLDDSRLHTSACRSSPVAHRVLARVDDLVQPDRGDGPYELEVGPSGAEFEHRWGAA